jgi:hypothetical protein
MADSAGMPPNARGLSLAFAAGVVGALANAGALWVLGASGALRALDVSLAPAFTPAWLYPRLVWGGLWGLLFLLPLAPQRWVAQGLMLSLFPSAVQLFVIFPYRTGAGVLGLEHGALTPLVVLAANAAWGLAASAWLRATGR